MLTVKHLDYDTEQKVSIVNIIGNVSHTSYMYKPKDSKEKCLSIFFKDGGHSQLNTGFVYIMNENGSTVEQYDLK